MMRLGRVVAAIAVAMAGTCAFGWDREPSTVLGVRIGASLADAGLPACSHAVPPGAACYEREFRYRSSILRSLRNPPKLSFEYRASVSLAPDDTVGAISLHFKHSDFRAAMAALEERYGPAMSKETMELATRAGVRVASSRYRWAGTRVSIDASEHAGDIDTASVYFTDKHFVEKSVERQRERRTDDAAKF